MKRALIILSVLVVISSGVIVAAVITMSKTPIVTTTPAPQRFRRVNTLPESVPNETDELVFGEPIVDAPKSPVRRRVRLVRQAEIDVGF